MQALQLINNFPTLTPMEENRTNLEATITMMMIIGQLAQEPADEMRDALTIAAAAMHNPAEA
ncbi:MAG: hypothetical protein VYC76_06760 [Pseudomonadota bacterium]|nr:hypothetical protein [Pseudomonadota bacterium]